MTELAPIAYVLCALTAAVCILLLGRAYARTGFRLLFWAGVCFAALATENVILFFDREIIHTLDLSLYRNGVALLGLLALLYGMIMDSGRKT